MVEIKDGDAVVRPAFWRPLLRQAGHRIWKFLPLWLRRALLSIWRFLERFDRKSFVSWVLLVAFAAWITTGVIVNNKIAQPELAGLILGTALGAWAFVLVCTLALVGRAVVLGLFPVENAIGGNSHTSRQRTQGGGEVGALEDASNGDSHTGPVDRLKGIVLSAGLAAGLGCGIVVFYHGWKLVKDKSDLFEIITGSIGPAAASGILLALLVATGAIVFIFEEKVGGFTRQAGDFTDKAKKAADQLNTARNDINAAAPEIKNGANTITQQSNTIDRATITISNLLHSLKKIDMENIPLNGSLGRAESYYLRSCFRSMSNHEPQVTAALQKIFESYWYEEASDIARFSVVTNARNYTGFLMSAVESLLDTYKEQKLHFYTTTPAGPYSLINWPDNRFLWWRERPFISAYMLFIRELVHQNKLIHHRWIWSKINSENPYQKHNLFGQWDHYERQTDEFLFSVLGIPIPLKCFLSHPTQAFILEPFSRVAHKPLEDMEPAFAHLCQEDNWEAGLEPALMPMATQTNGGNTEAWKDLAKQARTRIFQTLEHVINKYDLEERIKTAIGRSGLEHNYGDEFSKLCKSIDSNKRCAAVLESADKWLPFLQALESALLVDLQTDLGSGVSELYKGLQIFGANLVRLRWCDHWTETEYHDGSLPTLAGYFGRAFHTGGSPYYALPSHLSNSLFKKIGPEFAILGVEEDGNGDEQYSLALGLGRQVSWKLALQSTISSPWTAGEMKVITQDRGEHLKQLCEGIRVLYSSKDRHTAAV